MIKNTHPQELNIPNDILDKWQNIVDIMAKLIDIPTALIMRRNRFCY